MQPETSFEQRLSRLEAQNKRLRILAMSALALAVVAIARPGVSAQAQATTPTRVGALLADQIFVGQSIVVGSAGQTGTVTISVNPSRASVLVSGPSTTGDPMTSIVARNDATGIDMYETPTGGPNVSVGPRLNDSSLIRFWTFPSTPDGDANVLWSAP